MDSYSNDISETRTIGRGAASLLFGRVASIVLSLVVVIIITRMLGPEKFGIYSFVMAVAAVILTLSSLINQGMMRYAVNYFVLNELGKAKDIILKSAKFLLAISVVSLALLIVFSSFLDSFQLILISLPFIYFSILCSFVVMVFYCLRKMHVFVLDGVLKNVFLVMIIPVLIAGYGLQGSLIAYDIAALLVLLILACYLYFSFWKKLVREPSNESVFEIFRFSLPDFLSTVITSFTKRLGVFLLTFYAFIYGMSEVGYFSLALSIILSLGSLLSAVPDSAIPAILKFKFQGNDKMVQEVVDSSLKYSLIFALPIILILIFFSEPLVDLVFKKEFGRTGLNLVILSFYLIVMVVMKVCSGVIVANNDIKYFFYAGLLSFVIFSISAVILLPIFASRGIALAFLLGSIGSAILYVWRVSRHGVKLELRQVVRVRFSDIKKIAAIVGGRG